MTRGLIAAAACTLLAFWGHADAGGASPSVPVLLALAVPLTTLTVLLADRRRGPLTILALVGGSQLALHLLMQLLGGSDGRAGMSSMAGMPGMTPASGMNGMTGMGGPAGLGMPAMDPVLMSGAHLLATLVTAAVLCGAEQAALALACALVETLLPTRALAAPAPVEPSRPTQVRSGPRDLRLRGVLTRRLNLRRGPPAAAVAG